MTAHLSDGGSQILLMSHEEAFHRSAQILQLAIEQGTNYAVFSSEVILRLENVDLEHFANHFKAFTGLEETAWVINGLNYAETFLGSVECFPVQFCESYDGLPFKVFLDEDMLHRLRVHPAITHGAGSFFVPESSYDFGQLRPHRDIAIWDYQLQQQAHSPGTAVGPITFVPSSPASASGKAKIKRPPNAFILFRQAHHTQAVNLNPGMHNNQISKILGGMWQSVDEHTRAYYVRMAADAKAEHLRLHPEYRYQPRKSSEKKRRMSKKKREALFNESKDSTVAISDRKGGHTAGTTIISTDAVNYINDLQNIKVNAVYKNTLTEDLDENSEVGDSHEVVLGNELDNLVDLAVDFEEDF